MADNFICAWRRKSWAIGMILSRSRDHNDDIISAKFDFQSVQDTVLRGGSKIVFFNEILYAQQPKTLCGMLYVTPLCDSDVMKLSHSKYQ